MCVYIHNHVFTLYLKYVFCIKPERRDRVEEFIFGDGQVDYSKHSWGYPTFINGKFMGVIDIAECTVPCPPLFSLGMAKKWKCVCDHDKGLIKIKKFNHEVPFDGDTPFIDVFDCDGYSLNTAGMESKYLLG